MNLYSHSLHQKYFPVILLLKLTRDLKLQIHFAKRIYQSIAKYSRQIQMPRYCYLTQVKLKNFCQPALTECLNKIFLNLPLQTSVTIL
jgi:hypothetical protein